MEMINKELYAAMIKFQSEMPTVFKNADNPFFKSTYADLAEIVKAAKPYLAKNDLGVIQEVFTRNEHDYLSTTLIHSSGQKISSELRIRPKDGSIQSLGAAITYMRRYAYSSILGIVADEDDDGNSNSYTQAPKPKVETISVDQEEELQVELRGEAAYAKKILEAFKINSFSEMPREHYRKTLDRIREYKREKNS